MLAGRRALQGQAKNRVAGVRDGAESSTLACPSRPVPVDGPGGRPNKPEGGSGSGGGRVRAVGSRSLFDCEPVFAGFVITLQLTATSATVPSTSTEARVH
jgi:hypothetical protein